jgi:RNA polymerase sigma factor (sigma-70 family)
MGGPQTAANRSHSCARVRKPGRGTIFSFVTVPLDAVIAPARTGDDQAAFERSVMPEARRLFGLALTILGDYGEAEDAVQETMFSAWRTWSTLRDPSKQTSWLTRICVNHCIHRRRGLLRRILWSSNEWSATTVAALPDLEGQLLGFDGAFRRLSPPQRAVFVLHVHHGYTLDECAGLLGCRPGTARSHLGRAVAKLRKELSNA